MIPFVFGLVAAALGFLSGGSAWIFLAALPFAVPLRIGPVVGLVALLALLPSGLGPLWADVLAVAAGVLGAFGVLHRVGRLVPWVALPWFGGVALVLGVLWGVLPPQAFWVDADVAVRARILVLAAAALVLGALTYRPRYRNPSVLVPPAPPVAGGALAASGTAGGRDDMR